MLVVFVIFLLSTLVDIADYSQYNYVFILSCHCVRINDVIILSINTD